MEQAEAEIEIVSDVLAATVGFTTMNNRVPRRRRRQRRTVETESESETETTTVGERIGIGPLWHLRHRDRGREM